MLWTDLQSAGASRVMAYLDDLRQDRKGDDGGIKPGISAQTFNFYLQAIKQFCRWMVKDRRAAESPLTHLTGLNVRMDRRHDRRALSVDEMRCLLEAAKVGGDLSGPGWHMTGPERSMLYRLAMETGLRSSELRSLTRASFDLAGDPPTVTVEAAYSKRKRRDSQPLRSETVDALRPFLTNLLPTARVFKMPNKQDVAGMLKIDLAAGREAWIKATSGADDKTEREKSDFLKYRDQQGRYADFHALRHSFITNLGRAGVHFKTAQELARHSVPTLTARYTHGFKGDEVAAINALPDLSTPDTATVLKTGTDDNPTTTNHPASTTPAPVGDKHFVLASCLAERGRFQESNGDSGGRIGEESADTGSDENTEENRENCELEAVGVGFEPTKGAKPLPVFKTGAINRSATPPGVTHAGCEYRETSSRPDAASLILSP